jgi:hypothetical protein
LIRKRDAMPCARKKCDTQARLQLKHPASDGGVTKAQSLGGVQKAACLGHCHENPEKVPIHGLNLV